MDARRSQQRRRNSHAKMVVQGSISWDPNRISLLSNVWIADTSTRSEPTINIKSLTIARTIPLMAMKLASTAKRQRTSQVVEKEKGVRPHVVEKFHSQPERMKQPKSLCPTMTLICSTRTICQIS
eukprot:12206970-Karenia_brevis.AAC.1